MTLELHSPELHSPQSPADDSVGPVAQRRYYSITEAAALLHVSRVTLSRWIRNGRLPVARLGHRTTRIRWEDVERLLSEHGLRPLRSRTAHMPAHEDSPQLSPSSEHVVQFYDADAAMIDTASAHIGAALGVGGVGIVIATEAHTRAIEDRLQATGFDMQALRDRGEYIALDAADTLERLLIAGTPDSDRFVGVIGGLIAQAADGQGPVNAFGEMVALLAADGNHAAAVQLESLWNGLQQLYRFSLLCAYPMGVMGGSAYAEVLGHVCGAHGRVIPTENFSGIDEPDARSREVARLQQVAASLESEVLERRRIEEQLRRSERELRDFVENATEGLHWVGADGRIIWANRAELELLGYTADEYVGRPIAEFHADPDVIADILQRLAEAEELHDYEARLRARDGSIKYVLINSNVYRENGRFVHTRC
ncbi:MAG TPA: MEDS domain-containing protein, partial [Chloroflexota bacterium]|nr:MEDS domain-containing protein [Chloroflexota bacterium]